MERKKMFGFDFISDVDHAAVLDLLFKENLQIGDAYPMLITPNVDQVVKCHRPENAYLFDQLKQSYFILPDGQPIVWASKLKSSSTLSSRLTGSDLFPLFWKRCIETNSSVGLLMPNEQTGHQLCLEHNGAAYRVAGVIEENDKSSISNCAQLCIDMIREHNPKFLCLGIGFPKQELVALHVIERAKEENISVPMMLLLGASFEFHVGTKTRSPKILQRLGLEFAHRMFSEPRRMLKRYLIEDSKFFMLALRELLG